MDNYEKIKVVGRGAFGTVYLCQRQSDRKLVIIKQIPVEQMTKDERQSALNEAKVLSMLEHPNIIEYYENFLEDKALMIVMEYAEGGTLFDYLQQRGNALLDEDEVLYLFTQILLSLQHVHSKQILHRDLKTQNILMNKTRDVVKTGDFGISKILSSKSKAVTVVGTPCYISPELCEGKPYNQKSDIWAVGCILYELLTLKKAFEASTLPALVMKIMRGSVAPVSDRYSVHIRKLLMNMLQQDPDKRPTTNQVMAEPIVVKTLARIIFEMGRVKEPSRLPRPPSAHPSSQKKRSSGSSPRSHLPKGSPSRVVFDSSNGSSVMKPRPVSVVFTWGAGIPQPVSLQLPNSDIQIDDVAVGRLRRTGVTQNGRLIIWETSNLNTESMLPGALDTQMAMFIPRFLEGQSAVSIKHVSCGDMFTSCLTDRGILMTFGSGAHGCLGHGNFQDVSQAKIVESLLGYEISHVACGASHVVAVTTEHEVFSWGRGDNGRLGLGSLDSFPSPQMVPLSPHYQFQAVKCGQDCSVLITNTSKLLACGSNRYNKLGLDHRHGHEAELTPTQVQESPSFLSSSTYPLTEISVINIGLGTSHSAVLSASGDCWVLGSNQYGQMGCSNEEEVATPRQAVKVTCESSAKLTHVECGDMFTVAVSENGEVFSWGKGGRGRLGRPTQKTSHSPQQVVLPMEDAFDVTSLSCSHGNTLLAVTPIYN
ncbi:Serine/threonine-protein kinase Nek8 [Holothuria leucospilota]|uniref:non-specific serine/threonine protein kinase n=1 Tax=Holothuria leucospilota TaxID=206669 RepID=A0A9Q1CAC7_HOLLE|nr:Serine/threonine-protein kinase Nek8 [Holothuria leucospilota]